jgi:RimJ/RimL family protein N-acetyltransferase
MSTFLETERLVLRALVPEDVDDLVALDADPEVMRFLTRGQPTEIPSDRWAAIEKTASMAVNVASRRVMENAGMRYVRTFRARRGRVRDPPDASLNACSRAS